MTKEDLAVIAARAQADQGVEYYTQRLDQFIRESAPLVGAYHDRVERISILTKLLLEEEAKPGQEGMCAAMLAIALTR